jgi:hypothetical protein
MKKKTNLKKNKPVLSPLMQVFLESQSAPKISEKAGDDWISYGVGDYANLYPQFLIDLYNSSSTHSAIVNATSSMIAGQDILIDADETNGQYALLKQFINNTKFHDVFTKCAFDLKLQGSFAINVIWSKDRTSIAGMHHIPVEKLRVGKMNDKGEIDTFWISNDWENYRKKEHKPQPIPAFNMNDRTNPNGIIYDGLYSAGLDIYYAPDYKSCTNWILTDEMISDFHLSNIANGFAPSFWINFNNGVPTDEERRMIENKIAKKFTGAKNAGRMVLTFSESKEKEPTLTPIQLSQADKQYTVLNELTVQNIMIGHRVTSPMLLGVKTEGQLGGRNELLQAHELYSNTVIKPFQNVLLKCFTKLLKVNGFHLPIAVKQAEPITSKFDTDILKEVLTVDEIREELGYEPLKTQEDTIEDENQTNSNPNDTNLHNDKKPLKSLKNDGKQVISEQLSEKILDYLEDKGENQEDLLEEYNLVDIEDVKGDIHLSKQELKKRFFDRQVSGRPDLPSEEDNSFAKLKIRYRYVPASGLPAVIKTTRKFCRNMMRHTAKGRIFRLEDINAMTFFNQNKEFGSYDIFDYKGSYNCRHIWQRLYFTRKKTTKGEYLPDEGMQNEKIVKRGRNEDRPTTKNPKVIK